MNSEYEVIEQNVCFYILHFNSVYTVALTFLKNVMKL